MVRFYSFDKHVVEAKQIWMTWDPQKVRKANTQLSLERFPCGFQINDDFPETLCGDVFVQVLSTGFVAWKLVNVPVPFNFKRLSTFWRFLVAGFSLIFQVCEKHIIDLKNLVEKKCFKTTS